MLLFIKTRNASASGEYDPELKTFIVKKGSQVSEEISYSEKIRGADAIEKNRHLYVKDRIGWKDENGVRLKELLKK